MFRFMLASFLVVTLISKYSMAVNEISYINNDFSTKLFNKIATMNEDYVCSPLGVSVILNMLLDGAIEDTAGGIRNTIGYKENDYMDFNSAYERLIPKLQSTKDYQLSLANSIWVQRDFPIVPYYSNKMTRVFSAEVKPFTSGTDGLTNINNWVSDHTNRKIPNLLDRFPQDTVMVLVNAIYFKGNWVHQFNERLTAPGDFKAINSRTTVSYMNNRKRFPYRESQPLQSKILHLPYKGNKIFMAFVLPNEMDGNLNDIVGHKDFQNEVFRGLYSEEVDIRIPKFKTETTVELNKPLIELGMYKAFSDYGNFSGITPSGAIKVSRAMQKALIEVNERGSEAAAATAFVMTKFSMPIARRPLTFHANHPFLYALYDKETESILFMGKFLGTSKAV